MHSGMVVIEALNTGQQTAMPGLYLILPARKYAFLAFVLPTADK